MIVKVNNRVTVPTVPMYEGLNIIISIDSSKSNSGIVVHDETGEILDVIEFNGEKDGTSEYDTLALCFEQRKMMSTIFSGSRPFLVGIENIITKTYKKKQTEATGMDIHMSRFKITAVFMSFISFFQDKFGVTAQLIPNQSWKAATLPERFRHHDGTKGSLEYFKSINFKYQYYSDDATDAICIGKYLCMINKIQSGIRIKEPETALTNYKLMLTNRTVTGAVEEKRFLYNDKLTLEQNAVVMANETRSGKKVAVAEIPISVLSFEEIYANCVGRFSAKEDTVKLWVVVGG